MFGMTFLSVYLHREWPKSSVTRLNEMLNVTYSTRPLGVNPLGLEALAGKLMASNYTTEDFTASKLRACNGQCQYRNLR